MERNPIIINLIGGPGCGKSTIASGIFFNLKKMGVNCEMALEYAKDKVWEESFRTLDDQIYIFGKQFHRLWRLKDKVNVIITDSPILLSLYYNNEYTSINFKKLVIEQFNQFNNIVYFIDRGLEYQREGRMQTLEEAIAIDNTLMNILKSNGITFNRVKNDLACDTIINDIRRFILLDNNKK